MSYWQETEKPFLLEKELLELLEDFSWHMHSLLGGSLFAVVAQKPAWPSARLNRSLLNVLVLAADLRVSEAESVFQQYFLRSKTSWPFPVDIVGYQDFAEKLKLGDPAAIFLCTDGYVIYDPEGAFARLKDKVRDLDQPIPDKAELQDYLAQKRDAHFKNVGFLLARLLSEIYMGTAAGLAHQVVTEQSTASISLLRDLAQWEEIKQHLQRRPGRKHQDLIRLVDDIVDDIIWLITRPQAPKGPKQWPNYGQALLKVAAQLAKDVEVRRPN